MKSTGRWPEVTSSSTPAWPRASQIRSSRPGCAVCRSSAASSIRTGGPDALRDAIAALAANRERLARLSQAALDYANEHHVPERAAPLVELLKTGVTRRD